MGLGENLGPLRHDSTTFPRCQGKWVHFEGCFWLFWGSDGGPWGHRCVVRPPWMCRRWDGVANWVRVKIKGCCNMILITVKICHGKRVYVGSVFGYFGALMGACGVTDACHGLPGYGLDGVQWHYGSGLRYRGPCNMIFTTFQRC